MKIDYAGTLNTLEGPPFQDQKGGALTLGSLIIIACSTPIPGDESLAPLDKYKVGEIAACVHRGLDLSSEQVTVAKERIAKAFNNPVLIYLAHDLIEGK